MVKILLNALYLCVFDICMHAILRIYIYVYIYIYIYIYIHYHFHFRD